MYTQRAFEVFQRKLENRVAHIPFVRSDDILISGKKDKDHLENLGQVMGIIQKKKDCVLNSENMFLWQTKPFT